MQGLGFRGHRRTNKRRKKKNKKKNKGRRRMERTDKTRNVELAKIGIGQSRTGLAKAAILFGDTIGFGWDNRTSGRLWRCHGRWVACGDAMWRGGCASCSMKFGLGCRLCNALLGLLHCLLRRCHGQWVCVLHSGAGRHWSGHMAGPMAPFGVGDTKPLCFRSWHPVAGSQDPLSEFAGELQGASLVDVLIGLEENQH